MTLYLNEMLEENLVYSVIKLHMMIIYTLRKSALEFYMLYYYSLNKKNIQEIKSHRESFIYY